jgi:hypothetical protein
VIRRVNGLVAWRGDSYRHAMPLIRLDAPTFHRDVEVDVVTDLVEAEGMTWARDGEVQGVPRYVPAAAG